MGIFNDAVRVEVRVRLPWAEDELVYGYAIDRHQAREGLVPLPRDREIDQFSCIEAQRQIERRSRLVHMVSEQIAGALISACESQDTVRGYPKKV